ncbi:MAG TPA: beta-phosphoglucomutase [Phycisphaerae bacterium]|nr:beta-phosphoglucomutase [Phycisphaerae bacterium]
MTIRGVIFDLDGVLVSTDELHYRAWKELADAEGIPFDREINHRLRGVSRMESLRVILERATKSYDDAAQAVMAERKNERYRQFLEELSAEDLLPGASEMLDGLRARGVRTAVASASRNAPLILEKLRLTSRLDAWADGNDAARSKPDPEVFLIAAERLGLAPKDCVVIEDAAAGVEAASRAGMACVAIGSAMNEKNVALSAMSLRELTCESMLEILANRA